MAARRGRLSRIGRATRLSWRGDRPLRDRLRNIGHLLAGNFLSSVTALIAVALAARALGAEGYGFLALTITYVRAVERLVSFQSWQPMIKYGAALDEPGDRADLKVLLKFGFCLDVGGAVAAWLAALAGAMIATLLFGWEQRTFELVAIYCTVLLFSLTGMPIAVLRLAGRFRITAYALVISNICRVTLCVVGLAIGGDLAYFLMVWMATQIAGYGILVIAAIRELRRQRITGLLRVSLKGVTARFPGLWGFALSTNLSLTLRSSAQQFDTLLVGALAGPAAAGLYNIAKQIGKMAQSVGANVQAVIYPDVARLWAMRAVTAFRRAVMQVEVALAAFGTLGVLFFLVTAEPLLKLMAGPEFASAGPLLIVQMVAVTLTLAGSAANTGLLAMGLQRKSLIVVIASTLAFHLSALVLIPHFGAMGANLAHVIRGLIWLVGLFVIFRSAVREGPAAQPEPPASSGWAEAEG
jgi:O-antigen/teichoic acid export membrane protein